VNVDGLIQKRVPLILSVAAALVAVNLAVYFLAVSNLDKHTKGTKAKVVQLREQVKALEKQDKQVSGTVSRIKMDRQVVDDLAGKVLTTRSQRLVTMQNELQKLLESHRLQTDAISYSYDTFPKQESSWGRRYLKMTMQIPLGGAYQDIKGFIKEAQESPQFLLLEDVSLSSSTQAGAALRMNLIISTYFIATDQDFSAEGPRGKA